jgi:hypothetical protein
MVILIQKLLSLDPSGIFARFSTHTFLFVCLTLSLIEIIATDDTLPWWQSDSAFAEYVAELSAKFADGSAKFADDSAKFAEWILNFRKIS